MKNSGAKPEEQAPKQHTGPTTRSSTAILCQQTDFRMGNKVSKTKEKRMKDHQPPTNTPARFLYNTYGDYTCKYLLAGEIILKETST